MKISSALTTEQTAYKDTRRYGRHNTGQLPCGGWD